MPFVIRRYAGLRALLYPRSCRLSIALWPRLRPLKIPTSDRLIVFFLKKSIFLESRFPSHLSCLNLLFKFLLALLSYGLVWSPLRPWDFFISLRMFLDTIHVVQGVVNAQWRWPWWLLIIAVQFSFTTTFLCISAVGLGLFLRALCTLTHTHNRIKNEKNISSIFHINTTWCKCNIRKMSKDKVTENARTWSF